MEQLQQQYNGQRLAVRSATQAVHAAQQALETGQSEITDLEADKRTLQQLAEEMQQQLATNSQVHWSACLHWYMQLVLCEPSET